MSNRLLLRVTIGTNVSNRTQMCQIDYYRVTIGTNVSSGLLLRVTVGDKRVK